MLIISTKTSVVQNHIHVAKNVSFGKECMIKSQLTKPQNPRQPENLQVNEFIIIIFIVLTKTKNYNCQKVFFIKDMIKFQFNKTTNTKT